MYFLIFLFGLFRVINLIVYESVTVIGINEDICSPTEDLTELMYNDI